MLVALALSLAGCIGAPDAMPTTTTLADGGAAEVAVQACESPTGATTWITPRGFGAVTSPPIVQCLAEFCVRIDSCADLFEASTPSAWCVEVYDARDSGTSVPYSCPAGCCAAVGGNR